MATVQYGIKDILTNKYFSWRGHGRRSIYLEWAFNENIDMGTLYSSPTSCKAFINSYNKSSEEENNCPDRGTPIKRNLVVIQIKTTYEELY